MTFQAYLDNIRAKTGKGVDDFKNLADEKGFTQQGKLKEGVKAGEIVKWLKDDFGLGRGHAMAIYAALKPAKAKLIRKKIRQQLANGRGGPATV
jgi:hypothetical protein